MRTAADFLKRWTSAIILAVLASAALVGIALILYATNYGPWAFSDATTYLWTARNLAAGKGLVMQNPAGDYHLLTWHPPLFPILLSLPVALGADALQAARWLNAAAFGITVFMCGLATWRFTRSVIATLSVTALILAAIDLLFVFSGAMSEALFIVLCISALYFLVVGVQKPLKPFLLALSGTLAGLSFLARYTGLVTVATVLIVAVLAVEGTLWRRLRRILPAALPAVIIPAGWSLLVFLSTRTIGGRSLLTGENLRTDLPGYIQQFGDVLAGWLPFLLRGNHILPPAWKLILGALVVAAVLALGLRGLHKRGKLSLRLPHLTWLFTVAVFFLAYLAFHLLSFIFSSAAPAVDRRLLSPLLLSFILLLGAVFSLPWQVERIRFRPGTWILLAYTLLSLFYFRGKLQDFLYEQHHFGLGYTSKRWQESALIERAGQLDPQVTLAANDFALLLFYHGRFPYAIDLSEAAAGSVDLPGDKAYLVLFRPHADFRFGDQSDFYLAQVALRCPPIYEDGDGFICEWHRPASQP